MATREAVKVSGKSVAEFYARMTEGERIECVENTYRLHMGTDLSGRVATVVRPGKTSVALEMDGGPFHMVPPKRVADVLELTEDTITYRIPGREGYTATWRILPTAVR